MKVKIVLAVITLIATLLAGCTMVVDPALQAGSAEDAVAMQDDATVEARIEKALQAAGPAITDNATVMDWPSEPGGEMIVLREGTNRWTCFPPEAHLPEDVGRGMCVDEVWLAFQKAKSARVELPEVTTPGIAYMLGGGGGASTTDPFATEPAPGQDLGTRWTAHHDPHAR